MPSSLVVTCDISSLVTQPIARPKRPAFFNRSSAAEFKNPSLLFTNMSALEFRCFNVQPRKVTACRNWLLANELSSLPPTTWIIEVQSYTTYAKHHNDSCHVELDCKNDHGGKVGLKLNRQLSDRKTDSTKGTSIRNQLVICLCIVLRSRALCDRCLIFRTMLS